jgi:hypothetical protein
LYSCTPSIKKKLVHKNSPSPPHPGFYNANTVKSSKELEKKLNARYPPPSPPGGSTTVHLWLASDKFNNILEYLSAADAHFYLRYYSDTVGGSKNVNFFDFFIWTTFDSNF